MRVAIISDIHGNRVALDAVLQDLDSLGPYELICLGDVVALGPQPSEAAERVQELGCPVVMGNTDAWLLKEVPMEVTDENTRRMAEVYAWTRERLPPALIGYMGTFQPTIEIPLDEGSRLLCYHGSPQSNVGIILPTSTDEELESMFTGVTADVLAGGHTHVQMLRPYADAVLINPGSVGLPGSAPAPPAGTARPPSAEYAVLTAEEGSLSVEFRRVLVDVEAIIEAAYDNGRPHADLWAAEWRGK